MFWPCHTSSKVTRANFFGQITSQMAPYVLSPTMHTPYEKVVGSTPKLGVYAHIVDVVLCLITNNLNSLIFFTQLALSDFSGCQLIAFLQLTIIHQKVIIISIIYNGLA